MAGYIGSKAVLLSTTAATVTGAADIGGDLTVDTDTLYVDSTNNRVGVGTTTPATALDVTGTVTADGLTVDGDASVITLNNTDTSLALGQTLGEIKFNQNDPSDQGVGTVASIEVENRGSIAGYGKFNFKTGSATSLLDRLSIAENGDISFYEDTGTTPKFFWDASAESLGIGTSSPAYELHLSAANPVVMVESTNSTEPELRLKNTLREWTNYVDTSGNIIWRDRTAPAERLRVNSTGLLSVGTTSHYGAYINSIATGPVDAWASYATSTGGVNHLAFRNPNGFCGAVGTTGTSTYYNTSSDYRLKEDVQPMVGASSRVLALNPVNFAWKSDGSRVDGFLAHEAQAVVPEAVTGEKDAMRTEEYEVTPAIEATYDEDGNILTEAAPAVMGTREVPDYQGIDQSKLVPLLTAALQEALNEITDLKARVAALEAN